ncbi:putative cytoplasmic response regulator [Erysiphe neolycopersici]|uniref:Putative cytoplasmic response regulator n=1 Tax=Erysiphe neolycopersici TaxID=212602 RepID=A0A420HS37_9PEZI|nr:putative cytoplasmic response regulator [Erysiphe neolycopersici]
MPQSSTRLREVFRYYQPNEIESPIDDKPRSSDDPCLTAFAQLGVLRTNFERAYITLSTGNPKHQDYVLAESGPALSLQDIHDEYGELWQGVGMVKSDIGIGLALMAEFNRPENPPTFIFVGDISKDIRYKKFVPSLPLMRAMAVVPLKSIMHGIIIGTFSVIDSKPREGLSDDKIQFLSDMAITISEHLEAERLKMVQHRAERMIKALGLFTEGKGTLRDWWLEKGHRTQRSQMRNSKTIQRPLEHIADLEFGIQERVDYYSKHGLYELQHDNHRASFMNSSSSSSSFSQTGGPKTEPQDPRGARKSSLSLTLDLSPDASSDTSFSTKRLQMTRDVSFTRSDKCGTESRLDIEAPSSIYGEDPMGIMPSMTSRELLSSNIKKLFARASNLIRESISVDGVVYFDATVDSTETGWDGRERNDLNICNPEPIDLPSTVLEDSISQTSLDTKTDLQFCDVLGYSTKTKSSLYGHQTLENLSNCSVSVLKKFLTQYPQGFVFNFDEDGNLSSGSEDSSLDPQIDLERRLLAVTILSILPGAKSVFWYPLWDQNNDRWFSGSFAWSNSSTRILCIDEDLNYLAAFGNSTMAEVSRLSAQVLSKMKIDFISSISHELRSPLHGVLASVEYLRETDMNDFQIDMANNIYTSGKILLDTINHVLDFSKVNPRVKDEKKLTKRPKVKVDTKEINEKIVDRADLCFISEEVIDTVFTGYVGSKKVFAHTKRDLCKESNQDIHPIFVIIKIPFRINWTYEVDKGAWRRIVMNLFSNGMKYTSSGFVKITLDVELPTISLTDKEPNYSILVLKISDSGRGISEDFLRLELYKPFTQEDSLSPGAGLGLSIVKAIVHNLNGKMSFVSEPGTGTEVTVRIPLKQDSVPKKIDERKFVMEVRSRCNGFTVQMIGFDRYPDLHEEPTGILSPENESILELRRSIEDCLRDWFGIQPVAVVQSKPITDLVMVLESELNSKLISDLLNKLNQRHTGKLPVVIILTNDHPKNKKKIEIENFKCLYLQQPYGPYKIAKALYQAFCLSNIQSTRAITETLCEKPQSVTTISKISSQSLSETSVLKNPSSPKPDEKPGASSSKSDFFTGQITTPHINISRLPELQNSFSTGKILDPSLKKDLCILLVEDNEINLQLLIATMRRLKLKYTTALNGLEALNAYKQNVGRFDAVFMGLSTIIIINFIFETTLANVRIDISMPIMSGIESSRHIRTFEKENNLKPVTLIALTGAANESTRTEAFRSGIDLFLTKPVPMKAIRSILDDLSRQGKAVFVN